VSIDITRSIHPDLLDEYTEQMQQLAAGATAENTSPRRRRGRGAPPQPESPDGDSASAEPEHAATDGSAEGAPPAEPAPAPAEPPEWLGQLQGKTDPREILGVIREHLSREELASDPFFQGWIGDLSNQRARKILEDQQRADFERQRTSAYEQGDLYTLGQLNAAEIQRQREQSQRQQDPYMLDVANFQSSLPEAVQREVQGRQYDSFGAYLTAVQQAAIRHGVEQEVNKRGPALQKAELSQTVGSEQSPELDGGPAQAYREITDAQIAAMTLEESERYLDEKGRPRPGVRLRLTRGVDIRDLRR